MKFQMVLAMAIASSICGAQDRPDPAAYQQLFRQVAELKSMGAHPTARTAWGEVPLKVPELQDAVGLTDAEVETLNTTAADCETEIAALEKAAAPLIFESRLEIAGAGQNSDELARRLKELDERRKQMVLAHVQQLKTALPPASFARLDAYVRAPADAKKGLTPSAEIPAGAVRKP
jgi:DNA polymerase/3'-5' exonuclease PolX